MNSSRLMRALVLGARPDSGNIGDAIVKKMAHHERWEAFGDDCAHADLGPDHAPIYSVHHLGTSELVEVDGLVVTLGATSLTPFETVDARTVSEVIYACLGMPLEAVRRYVQAREGKGGRVIVIGSYAHDHSLTQCAAYCAAKAGLAAAIKELGWELTDKGFTFSIIHPYHVPSTPMGAEVVEGMMSNRGMTREEAEAYQAKDNKLGSHLTPRDIAEYVGWMLDAPEARWLSGQGLSLYGGVR